MIKYVYINLINNNLTNFVWIIFGCCLIMNFLGCSLDTETGGFLRRKSDYSFGGYHLVFENLSKRQILHVSTCY